VGIIEAVAAIDEHADFVSTQDGIIERKVSDLQRIVL
jgi:hypothetical protein